MEEGKENRKKKRVFAYACRMPQEMCSERVKNLAAVSEDGKELFFEVDQTSYSQSIEKMWNAFYDFCRGLGMQRGRDELWYSQGVCERFDGPFTPCKECKASECFFFGDALESLGCWDTMYLEDAYSEECQYWDNRVSFEEFKKQNGYNAGREPYAGRDLFRKFAETVGEKEYSEQECERIARDIEDRCEEMRADTERCAALLMRLWRNAPALYARSIGLLWAGYEERPEAERRGLDRLACRLAEEQQAAREKVSR